MQVSEPFNFSRLESILYLLLCGFKCSERCPVCLCVSILIMLYLWDKTLFRWPSPPELLPVLAEVTDGSSSLFP